jgi:purine nucleoside phosphorylase
MLELLKADVYGMSTVPEVIAARHSGARGIAALSVITDMCRWDVDDDPTIEQCLQVVHFL